VLAGSGLVAACGLLAAAAVPSGAVAYGGFALAGVGLAFCFPTAMALAGEAGRRADGGGGERELGFVTTVAYAGFLGGPPLVGGVASLAGLSASLGFVGLLAALITPTAWALRTARRRDGGAPREEPRDERELLPAGRESAPGGR
jgi:MFS family permease